MDLSKLTPNNWIAGGGAVVLIINLFLPWYGVSFGAGFGSVTANAFDAGFLAWFGSFVAIAAGAIVVLKALDVFDAKVGGLAAEQLAMVLGALATLLILLKLLADNDFTRFGIYLGLIAAAATAAGAFLSGKDAGVGIPNADDFKGDGGGGGGSSTF